MATTINSLVRQARVRLIESLALVTPGSPLVSPQGTPGVASIIYKIVATNTTGHSDASQNGSTTTGAATLNGTNFNRLTWTAVPQATGYKVYRSHGGATVGLIATIASGATVTLDDTGLVGDAATAPTDNTSGVIGSFWSDTELIEHAINCCKDLWRAFVDLHENHFSTIDETTMSIAVGATVVAGVPTDVFRILLIEPRDTSDSGASRGLKFFPKKYNSKEFIAARTLPAVDPSGGGVILYDIFNAGSPVAAPTLKLSRSVTSAVLLRVQYNNTLPDLTGDSNNPIPGEADEAVICWIVAHALGKEREDRSPDPNWLAKYATEKGSVLIVSAPRQEQEPRVVSGVFDDIAYNDFD